MKTFIKPKYWELYSLLNNSMRVVRESFKGAATGPLINEKSYDLSMKLRNSETSEPSAAEISKVIVEVKSYFNSLKGYRSLNLKEKSLVEELDVFLKNN